MTDVRMTERIGSYRDLRVYQAAFELQQEIFEITKCFPKEEMYSLTDQMRRSSRAIGANMAEAWQKRRYEAHHAWRHDQNPIIILQSIYQMIFRPLSSVLCPPSSGSVDAGR